MVAQQRSRLGPRPPGQLAIDPRSRLGFVQLRLVQEQRLTPGRHPHVEAQVGRRPRTLAQELYRREDVGVDPRERAVGAVEEADVVPRAGKVNQMTGEPGSRIVVPSTRAGDRMGVWDWKVTIPAAPLPSTSCR